MPDTNLVSLVGRLNKAAAEIRDADLSILLMDASIKIVELSGSECGGIIADIEAREALQNQSLRVALEGVKEMINNGNPDEAAQALGALSPFFTSNGKGHRDYFKAMEQIEIGEPYTAGVMYLDNLIESLKRED